MNVVIAGGTGSLGRRLADDFRARGDNVTLLTRRPRAGLVHRQVEWDGRTVGPWASELESAIVVNLAGELVDRRPTARNIEMLRRSRVESTRALVEAASQLAMPPSLWLQMSTLAIRSVRFLCDHPGIDGVVHVTAPNPIPNREMMRALRVALHRPWSPPTPKPLVHLGAAVMGSDPALALTSRRCIPRRLVDAGFEFDQPTFDSAVEDLLVSPTA